MKRSKQVNDARPVGQPRALSAKQLRDARGGASTVEYALLLQAAPVEANAWISWD